MNDKVLNLIKYIVCYATDHEINLTTVRLVKLVYLADLYHARFNNGQTITGFPWAFINFGPYCQDVMRHIDKATSIGFINGKVLESKYSDKTYTLFSCNDEHYSDIKKEFQLRVMSDLQYAIRKYGDDTAQLLDYVYFKTEPMNDVKKGDLLDFSLAKQPEPISSVETGKLAKKDVERVKLLVKQLKEKHDIAQNNLLRSDEKEKKWKDKLYLETLDAIDSETFPEELRGIIRIGI